MRKEQILTFEKVSELIEGLPPVIIGEVVMSLIMTMAEKYGDEPFELDTDLIEEQLIELFELFKEGMPINKIINKIVRSGKIYKKVSNKINNSVLEHFPLNEQKELVNLILVNKQFYILSDKKKNENPSSPSVNALPYAPNRKYQDWQFQEFQKLCDERKSQTEAYDILVKKYGTDFPANKQDSFLISYRKWNRERYK